VPGVLVLLAAYAALWSASEWLGPLSPLPPLQLAIAHWVNVALVFAMFYGLAAYFRAQVLRAERQLLKMATVDPLTGLANRSQFHVRATAELARSRRERQPLSLMLADVDFFKRINDEFGHDAGDRVLRRLAELMQQALRESDVLARWGGEEFLALLPASDTDQARQVAERVRQAVASVQIDIGGQLLQVTMSFGVAGLEPALDAETDLQSATLRADRALYTSKQNGRNRVTCATGAEPGPA
jgi:diguanylate cyclase (GGDEF)-like protein